MTRGNRQEVRGARGVRPPLLTNLQWLPVESGLNRSQSSVHCGPKPPPKCHLPLLTHHPLLHLWLVSLPPPSLPPSPGAIPQPEKLHYWMAQEQLSASTSPFYRAWAHRVESCMVAWRQQNVSPCAVRVCLQDMGPDLSRPHCIGFV